MTYTERIINATTGEETIRDYTPEEIEKVEAAIAATQAKIEADAITEAAKAAAKEAVLDKLGLSAAEVAALLG